MINVSRDRPQGIYAKCSAHTVFTCQTKLLFYKKEIKFCNKPLPFFSGVFYASATVGAPEALCFRVVRPSVRASLRASVCASVRPSVRPSVLLYLARFREKYWTDFHQIFFRGPPRGKHELIRFSAYMVSFQGNDMAKYGKMLTFWHIVAIL